MKEIIEYSSLLISFLKQDETNPLRLYLTTVHPENGSPYENG